MRARAVNWPADVFRVNGPVPAMLSTDVFKRASTPARSAACQRALSKSHLAKLAAAGATGAAMTAVTMILPAFPLLP